MNAQNLSGFDIYKYDNLKNFLQGYVDHRKSVRPEWSYGVWANSLGLPNTASLTRVMNGDRSPGKRFVRSLIDYFEFKPLEKEHFLYMVLKSKADNDSVLSGLLNERCWGNKSPVFSDNSAVNAETEKPLLEIRGGDITGIIGVADPELVNAMLRPEGLEIVPINNYAVITMNICSYKDSSLGPYSEFYMSMFCRPINGDVSQIGLIFRNILCSSKNVINLERMIWRNDYEAGNIEPITKCENRIAFDVHQESEKFAHFGFENKNIVPSPVDGNATIFGFANVYGSRSRFKLEITAEAYERPFDPANDKIDINENSNLAKSLHSLRFNPTQWMFRRNLNCDIYPPAGN